MSYPKHKLKRFPFPNYPPSPSLIHLPIVLRHAPMHTWNDSPGIFRYQTSRPSWWLQHPETGPLDEHRRDRASSLLTSGSVWIFRFSQAQGFVKGTCFSDEEFVNMSVTTKLRRIPRKSFQECMGIWCRRVEKSVRLESDNFEKR